VKSIEMKAYCKSGLLAIGEGNVSKSGRFILSFDCDVDFGMDQNLTITLSPHVISSNFISWQLLNEEKSFVVSR
jgi:hypothetical protein